MQFLRKRLYRGNIKTIQEFSVTDYDETYDYVKKVMKFVGIRLTLTDSPTKKLLWDILYWFEFANLVLTFILDALKLKEILCGGNFEDAMVIFRMLPCMGYLILAMLKSYKMVHHSYRPVYENLITELRSMWPEGELSEEEKQILGPALKKINFINKAYYYCNGVLFISFLLPSYVEIIRREMGEDVPRNLPFYYWVPFDPFQPIVHEFILTWQAWHTILTIWFMLCGDLLFCIFLTHITTQFDLLAVRIRKLIYVPIDQQLIENYPLGESSKCFSQVNAEEITSEQWKEKHQKEMALIVQRHNSLIRLSNDVEQMFSFTLFVNFFYSSIIICLCGFCCVRVEKKSEHMYKAFLTTTLSQVWLLCLFGQKLLESSAGVADALYSSGWYKATKKINSSILIMMHRSQREVQITTYGFSVVSLASYTVIIKTAWSYFTLLLNTLEPNTDQNNN